MNHTPTPYRQDPNEGLFIFAKDNAKPIAKVTSKSTAAFIVRACNAHEALVGALKLHLQFLDSLPSGWLGKTTGDVGLLNDAYIASSKSLKLARGE